jgi:hypothetical protein
MRDAARLVRVSETTPEKSRAGRRSAGQRTPPGRSLRLAGLVAVLLLAPSPGAAAPFPADMDAKQKERIAAAPLMAVHCADGSVLHLRVLEPRLTLETPYGKLVIPFSKIQSVECATRLPDAVARKVAVALADLGGSPGKRRDAAALLARLGVKAYPALVKLENAKDPDVRREVRQLLEKVREGAAADDLVLRHRDVVVTGDSRISGHIVTASVTVHHPVFGEAQLKLASVRTLHGRAGGAAEKDDGKDALPAPTELSSYQGQAGKILKFRVTGSVNGAVWGVDVYTLDSTLAAAAVHAGVVKAGKTAVVRVKIVQGLAAYAGSTRNGVTTSPFAAYPGAFQFVK